MKKILSLIDEHFERVIMVSLLSVMVLSITYQVVMRYVFHDAPSWTEELTRYAFIWCIYFGVSYGVKMDAHIRVMAVLDLLPAKVRDIMVLLSDIFFLIFVGFILYHSVNMTATIATLGRKSAAMQIPMYYIYSALPVGLTCIGVRVIQSIIRQVRRMVSPAKIDDTSADDLSADDTSTKE